MRITFTAAAVEYLTPLLQSGNKKLKFLHDAVGYCCADNGVTTLALIDELGSEDTLGEADPLSFYYEPQHEVYYEKHMTIDYAPQTNSFILKSPSQIYSHHLRFLK